MSFASDRYFSLKINALNGENAVSVAIDAAADITFPGPGVEVEEDLDSEPTAALSREVALGGYEVHLVRRGFSNHPGGSEYTSDYAICSFEGPLPLFEAPDKIDQSAAYVAALEAAELAAATHAIQPSTRNKRL
jgi:hypothetical protein